MAIFDIYSKVGTSKMPLSSEDRAKWQEAVKLREQGRELRQRSDKEIARLEALSEQARTSIEEGGYVRSPEADRILQEAVNEGYTMQQQTENEISRLNAAADKIEQEVESRYYAKEAERIEAEEIVQGAANLRAQQIREKQRMESEAAETDAIAKRIEQEAKVRSGEAYGVHIPFTGKTVTIGKKELGESVGRAGIAITEGIMEKIPEKFSVGTGLGKLSLDADIRQKSFIDEFRKEYDRIISLFRAGKGTSLDTQNLKALKTTVETSGIGDGVIPGRAPRLLDDITNLRKAIEKQAAVVGAPGTERMLAIEKVGVSAPTKLGLEKTIGGALKTTADVLKGSRQRAQLTGQGMMSRVMSQDMPAGMTGVRPLGMSEQARRIYATSGERISPSEFNRPEEMQRQLIKMLPEGTQYGRVPPIARTGRVRLPGTTEEFAREFAVAAPQTYGQPATRRIISPKSNIPGIRQVLGI